MVNGPSDLVRSLKRSKHNSTQSWNVNSDLEEMFDTKWNNTEAAAFPIDDEKDKNADISKRPGCRGMQNKHDPSHTRTPGECAPAITRWTSASVNLRRVEAESEQEDTRELQDSPASDLQAQDVEGNDLNEGVEPPAASGSASASSSSSSGARGTGSSSGGSGSGSGPSGSAGPWVPRGVVRIGDEDAPAPPAPPAPPAEEGDGGEGAGRQCGPRRVDAGSGEHASDWSRFDVSQSLRLLRSHDAAIRFGEVRKLHLRWWHATKDAMKTLFKTAGLPASLSDTIELVIDTSKECRAWTLPKTTN